MRFEARERNIAKGEQKKKEANMKKKKAGGEEHVNNNLGRGFNFGSGKLLVQVKWKKENKWKMKVARNVEDEKKIKVETSKAEVVFFYIAILMAWD